MATPIIKIIKNNMPRLQKPLVAFILAGFVAGCSSIPDAINPVEWFESSLALFSNVNPKGSQKKEDGTSQKQDVSVSDTSATFPKLSNISQQQIDTAIRGKGLVADVEGRKYAPAIARQGEATNVLSVAPPRPSVITSVTAPATKPKTTALANAPVTKSKTTTLALSPTTSTDSAKLNSTVSKSVPGQNDFQTRFVARLAEIRAEAAKDKELIQYSKPFLNRISMETVIVSSSGTDTNYGVLETKNLQSSNTVNNELTYISKPMTPLSDNVIRVATIRFENGSAKLSSRDRQILAKVVRLKKERGGRIRIVGHASSRTHNTDPVNHKMINFRVSAARANVVALELQRLGADRSQLQVDAVSDSSPEFLEVMPTGEAGNRRAEIYLDS
jgi:flagellar motor protein MotB